MTHLFVFQQFRFSLVAFRALITAEGFEGAMNVLNVVVQSGITGEMFGADMTHEPVSRSVLVHVSSIEFVLVELEVAVFTGFSYTVGSS